MENGHRIMYEGLLSRRLEHCRMWQSESGWECVSTFWDGHNKCTQAGVEMAKTSFFRGERAVHCGLKVLGSNCKKLHWIASTLLMISFV